MKNATAPGDKNKTKQDTGTDPLFFKALNKHFGFKWDLACTRKNQLCPMGLTPSEDSLTVDWSQLENWMYLNPEFKDIKPWAEKGHMEAKRGAKLIMLTPLSMETNWYYDYIYKKHTVRVLKGRLIFAGNKTPYPKGCMITEFDNHYRGVDVWDWRNEPYRAEL